jgi:Txe/YoeB family toxin of toxin-antitoxin system
VFEIRYTKHAIKDINKLKQSNLDRKVKNLLEIIRKDPFQTPPPYKKLVGDLTGAFSRRINRQHRLVYKVDKDHQAIIIIRMWTHYE